MLLAWKGKMVLLHGDSEHSGIYQASLACQGVIASLI